MFQNCSTEGAFESSSLSKSSTTSFEHMYGDHSIADLQEKPISTFNAPLMDRQMVVSILERAFGPRWFIEDSNIESQAPDFGYSCLPMVDAYTMINGRRVLANETEPCHWATDNFKLQSPPAAGVARASYLKNACSVLTDNSVTLDYFMSQLGSEEEVAQFSDASLLRAYQLFFVGKPDPSESLLDALRFISTNQPDTKKAWSAIAFSLCAPGQWQVL
mgnify:FL=1